LKNFYFQNLKYAFRNFYFQNLKYAFCHVVFSAVLLLNLTRYVAIFDSSGSKKTFGSNRSLSTELMWRVRLKIYQTSPYSHFIQLFFSYRSFLITTELSNIRVAPYMYYVKSRRQHCKRHYTAKGIFSKL
jgi:hypothetical protein